MGISIALCNNYATARQGVCLMDILHITALEIVINTSLEAQSEFLNRGISRGKVLNLRPKLN